MTEPAPIPADHWLHQIRNSMNYKKAVLTFASLVCFGMFWYAGEMLHVPEHRGHAASLMLQPNMALIWVVTAALTLLSVVVGSLIAGRIRADVGIFTAAAGLSA